MVPRPMPAAPRRYMTVVPQAVARGAAGIARGAACCASKVLNRVAQANARGAAQVLDRGAQAVARDAATLPQQEKNNSADMQRSRENINGFTCTVAR